MIYNDSVVDRLRGLKRGRAEDVVEVSNEVARWFAVIKQGLDRRPSKHDADSILESIRRIKLLQLDTINVVERSHYLVVLSRIGMYDKSDLDSLSYPRTDLFEQRSHEACLLPIESYPFISPELAARRDRQISNIKLRQLGQEPDRVFRAVLERIKESGSVTSKDFTDERKGERKGWWDRKPERVALEILWRRGYLAVQRRSNFLCYYDLAERIIPSRYLKSGKSINDFKRWAVTNSLDAQGIATAADVNDYYRQNIRETREILEKMVSEGLVRRMNVKEWKHGAYALSSDMETITRLADKPPRLETTTLLSPFDNLIWYRERMERMFGLHFRIEMYTPKAERTGGYYSMPVLHRGMIVGVADPKVDRTNRQMRINSLNLLSKVEVDESLINGLSKAMKEISNFAGCDTISIHKTSPNQLRLELERSIGDVAVSRSRSRA